MKVNILYIYKHKEAYYYLINKLLLDNSLEAKIFCGPFYDRIETECANYYLKPIGTSYEILLQEIDKIDYVIGEDFKIDHSYFDIKPYYAILNDDMTCFPHVLIIP